MNDVKKASKTKGFGLTAEQGRLRLSVLWSNRLKAAPRLMFSGFLVVGNGQITALRA